MNRSHSLTSPQLAKVNEYKALGYQVDPEKSSDSIKMNKGARRVAICWNGMVKASGAKK